LPLESYSGGIEEQFNPHSQKLRRTFRQFSEAEHIGISDSPFIEFWKGGRVWQRTQRRACDIVSQGAQL
jgi:hypothetical protein